MSSKDSCQRKLLGDGAVGRKGFDDSFRSTTGKDGAGLELGGPAPFLSSPLLPISTHNGERDTGDSKTLPLPFGVFNHQIEFYSNWSFQSESMLSDKNTPPSSGPPGRGIGWGLEGYSREEGESCSWANRVCIVPPTASGLQPGTGASLTVQPTCTRACCSVYTGASPPGGSRGCANTHDRLLPSEGGSHLRMAKGRN